MRDSKTTPDYAPGLEGYIRDPTHGSAIRVQVHKKNDISYYPIDEQGEIEVHSHFNEDRTYRLTISRDDKPTRAKTLETIFSGQKPNYKAILKQNRKEILVFLANA
jgi:hypothetical protein